MLRFSKKTEYALMAIQHIAVSEVSGNGLASTREISATYKIPYPLLAKIMQGLANHGLVKAVYGTKGGYLLVKHAEDISVADVMEVFDGRVAVAECFQHKKVDCEQWKDCSIKDPFYELNQRISDILVKTTVADLVKKKPAVAVRTTIEV